MPTNDKPTLDALVQGCESEKLHLSGAIQPFGALLRISTETGLITHISTNLADFAGPDADQLLGCPVGAIKWLSPAELARVPLQNGKSISVSRISETDSSRVDAQLIRCEDSILIELERIGAHAEPIAVHNYQRPLMTAPRQLDELAKYHQILLQAFRSIIGYDRVMLYRFHDDWSGEVIAEASASGLGSYLGLRFPASDIPAIARNLYLVNGSRMIPDARAQPVSVVGLTGDIPDLTWSGLRSVSPVHLQYLANMGVSASFSVPVRINGKLWALVACHNLQPCDLAPEQRNACEMLANAYALGMTSCIASHRLQAMDSMERKIDKVLEAISGNSDPLDGIEANAQELMDAVGATGFAMAVKSEVVITGEGPSLDEFGIVDHWFQNECHESLFATDQLSKYFPKNSEFLKSISGMVAVKSRSLRSGWIRFYWFRPAELQEVVWAGNPNKPMVENPHATALSPRRSFDRWVEIKASHSRNWTNEEKLVASYFRTHLLRWL